MNPLTHRMLAFGWPVIGGALLLIGAVAFAQASAHGDPLKPLTACLAAGPHKIDAIDRLPPTMKRRMVEAEDGERPVSTADGYRLVLSWPAAGMFANLKIEQSVPGHFAADREAILSQMRRVAARAGTGAAPPPFQQRSGVEIVQLQQGQLAVRGPTGFMTLFDPRTEAVVSAYLMNQSPQGGVYANMAEYELQRDTFINAFVLVS